MAQIKPRTPAQQKAIDDAYAALEESLAGCYQQYTAILHPDDYRRWYESLPQGFSEMVQEEAAKIRAKKGEL